MKIMHLGDLHIGKTVCGYSMLDDQRYILDQIIDIAKSQSVSTVLIAGDVYDRSVPPVEGTALLEDFLTRLSDMGLKVLIISGNHDSAERLSFGSPLMKSNGIFIAKKYSGTVEKVTLSDEHGDIDFYLLPFIYPAIVREHFPNTEIKTYNDAVKAVISSINLNKENRSVIISHQFVTGALVSDSEQVSVGGIDEVSAEIYSDFDYAALGHIHRPQKMASNLYYSGSILKYSLSEANFDKSVPIITLEEKGNTKIEFVPLRPLRDVREIKGKYEELMSPDYYNSIKTDDYIFACLTDEIPVPDAAAKLRSVYPYIMNISYDNITTQHIADVELKAEARLETDPLTLINDFYTSVMNKDMSEEQRKLILSLTEEIWR